VTPLSLGIETLGGVMTRLIERNTTVPTRKSETFSTAEDGQTSVHVKVYQGEREIAAANKLLGDFQLTGIPPAPRGIPQIEVTFDIDANGIVSVSARDKATNREQKITITGTSSLGKDEIDRMVKEAASHAEEDKKARERAETRNRAESLMYQTEKNLKDLGDKAPSDMRASVETNIANLRTALNSNDTSVEELQRLTTELEQSTYRLSELLYQQATGGEQGAPQNGHSTDGYEQAEPHAEPQDESVIDTEFKQ
jgi:molecular chaperone DnaK